MLYEVIAMPFVPVAGRFTPIATFEQTVAVWLFAVGPEVMVTVTEKAGPAQEPAIGVTV
jgi:hypothetical protein